MDSYASFSAGGVMHVLRELSGVSKPGLSRAQVRPGVNYNIVCYEGAVRPEVGHNLNCHHRLTDNSRGGRKGNGCYRLERTVNI